MTDLKAIARDLYKAAQSPTSWLLSAERLRDAAEVILKHEVQFEIPYFQAHAVAEQEAVAAAYADGNNAGVAEIKATPPNYPAAQLLYAYAIENVLKGLIITAKPLLIGGRTLNNALKSHNLIKLAKEADFTVLLQEEPVLKALSELSVWAGRYPVAQHRREQIGKPNSDELMDYGSRNPVMRLFFERARKELENKLAEQRANHANSNP